MAWAEDRALLNPSADPGAKTEGQAVAFCRRLTFFLPFGIGTNAINLRGMDAVTAAAGCLQQSVLT
jgi:hypothetical protein